VIARLARGVAGGVARGLGAPLALRDPFAPLHAIIVLGAPVRADGTLPAITAERVRAGAALYHAGGAPIVCATGGFTGKSPVDPMTRGGRGEADAIGDALLAAGVPASALRLERAARTTRENAAFTATLLAPDRVHTVWLVTQPFHARRARWLFRRVGLDARVWHIDDSLQYARPARALRWITREYAAWAAALVRR
jgi:uncharacterized SAM-binding protein YcdF (DUF218 family)